MLQRRRRTTRVEVERLEGRALLSLVADIVVIVPPHLKSAVLRGHTTLPTTVGETLEISASEHRAGHATIEAKTDFTEVGPSSIAGDSGFFIANLKPANGAHDWYTTGTFRLVITNITSRTHRQVVEHTRTEVPASID